MSMASKFGKSLVNMFTNDKKLNAEKAQAAAAELENAQEFFRKDGLKVSKTARFGFPYKPTCMAYDSVQRLLAIGTKNGYIKLFGGDSVEHTIFHASSSVTSLIPNPASSPGSSGSNAGNICLSGSPLLSTSHMPSAGAAVISSAILFIQFVINEGALVVFCEDSILSFWNLRQRQPGLLFSKRLVNEKATAMHLPFQSNWLYVGTEKGNIYILNVYNNFSQSGYDIKWNNVIDLGQKTKPGKVVHLSDCPTDSSKILLGYESGLICLWNIKLKRADLRFNGTAETMSSISWLHDGKQFISSHNNGSLIIWNCKSDAKASNILHPHMSEDDLIPQYNMVKKVVWETNKTGDNFLIFSDGLPSSDCLMKDAITIIKNQKLKTIIEMKEKIIDFLALHSTPWLSADTPPDSHGLVVLLENSFIVIDLKTENYPQFHHHHAIHIHDEPISNFHYVVDSTRAYFQNLLVSKEKHSQKLTQKQQQQQANNNSNSNSNNTGGATTSIPFYSELPYPINGGIKCPNKNIFYYNELIVTGHDDGSVKIWDTSGSSMNLLHKFKTHKYFNDKRSATNSNGQNQNDIDCPFKITAINMSDDYLAVAAVGGHVSLFRFYLKNSNPAEQELADIPLLEVPIYYEYSQDSKSNNDTQSNQSGVSNGVIPNENKKDLKCYLRTKIGFRRQTGYHPELVCLLLSAQPRIPVVNCVLIYSKNNMLLFGTDESIVCVDYANRTILMNVTCCEFYGPQDPFQRGQKSPKKLNKLNQSTEVEDSNPNDNPPHNSAHFLAKQFTVEGSFLRQSSVRELSRSSSNSSIENLTSAEGISSISINENSMTNSNTESTTQVYQIWLGTTYGSVIILNVITNTNTNSNDKNQDNLTLTSNQNVKSTIMSTLNATIIQLKGSILDTSFLHTNGDLFMPINCNNNYEAYPKSYHNPKINPVAITNNSSNSDLLDMDFDLIANAQISNSIADNFKSTTNAHSSAPSSIDIGGSGATNSPSSVSSSFVNPFANSLPEEKEVKDIKESSLKDFRESTKGLFRGKKHRKIVGAKTQVREFHKSVIGKKENSSPLENQERNLFVVITSETQIKVIAMPSQTCVHKYVFNDTRVAKASVLVVNSLSYLSCCLTNGQYITFNLPNLKPAASVSFSPIPQPNSVNERVARTFTFGTKGHSFYMCSPNEIQKLYLSNAVGSVNLTEMACELFDPKVVTPQQPKPNIFKSIFSVTPFDREELFGESSGKPSTTIIKNVEGEVARSKNEFSELQRLALERGEKLSSLQMKSEQMTQAASQYAANAHALANKYKKQSKWL